MEAVAAGAMEAAAAMSEQPPLAMSAPQHQLPQTAMSAPQHQLPQTAMSAPQQQVPLAMPPTAMSSSLPLAVAATVPVAGGAVLPMSTPVEAAIVQVQGGAVYQDAASTHPPPMTAEQALATAEAEGLVMPRSNGKTGYRGVTHVAGKKARPYQAWICRAGKLERLGRFATPEEAALCRARTPEGQKV